MRRKRGVRIHKIGLHVYWQVFVAKIFSKNAKLDGILTSFVFKTYNQITLYSPPKIQNCLNAVGAKLFGDGGLENLGLNH